VSRIQSTGVHLLILYDRQSQTFQDHAGAVINILNKVIQAKSERESTTLLTQYLTPYVILKSSPKIFRRLMASYSRPFWNGLSSVTPERLDTLPFMKPQRLTPSQTHRDEAFLLVISGEAQRYLACIAVQTPHLLEAAQAMKGGPSTNQTFYSDMTSGEVHSLLFALLSDLKDFTSIIAFLTTQSPQTFENIDAFKDITNNEEIEKAMNSCVVRVGICLQLLWLLVNSYAMEAHVDRIHPVLLEHLGDQVQDDREGPKGGEGNSAAAAEDDDDFDELDHEDVGNDGADLKKAESDRLALRPLVASYMSWLRLQVSHYNAVHTLGKACWTLSQASGLIGTSTLSIRVVANAHPGHEMLPWKELVMSLISPSPKETDITLDAIIAAVHTFMNTLNPANAGRRKCPHPTWYTDNRFGGTEHCEVGLAGLIDNQEVNADIQAAFRASV
jgi:hypothetical protein